MKLPIPDDWDGSSWCEWAVCWPDSGYWRALLMGFLSLPARGRTWDERTGSIVAVQATGKEIREANLPLRESIMSCTSATELAEAIRYLADRIYSKPCCDQTINVNVVQGTTEGGNTIYGDEPAGGLTGESGVGDPPGGYDSWEEYYAKKCSAANLVADGIISAYTGLGSISAASIAVLGTAVLLAIPGIITVPPSVIPLLIGALLGLGVSITVQLTIAGWLQDNRDDLVCILYNSDTVEIAVDGFMALIDEALAALAIASSLHPYIKAIALVLASTDTLNRLFDATLAMEYPNADCSNCEDSGCVDFVMENGTIESVTDNQDGTFTYVFVSDVDTYFGQPQRQSIVWEAPIPAVTGDCSFSWVQGSESWPVAPNVFAGYWYGCNSPRLDRSGLNDFTGLGPFRIASWWNGDGNQFKYQVTLSWEQCA